MPIKLDALIKRTQAAIDAETDPRKLVPLQASLSAYLSTKAEMDDEDDKDDKDDEDDSKAQKAAKAAKAAKAKAEATKHRAKAAEYKAKAAELEEAAKAAEEDDEEDDEEDKEEDEEEESEESAKKAAAALATVEALTGLTGDAALGAIRALAATAHKTAQDVAQIKRTQAASQKDALIASIAKSSTKAERQWLAGESLATVEGFVATRIKSGLVYTDEASLARPKHVQPGTEESLPADTREMIEQAVAAFSGDKEKYRADLVKANLASHKKQIDAALNGAAGRF